MDGKELSYNNLIALAEALTTVGRFPESEGPAAVVVKHTNPCGVAVGATAAEALARPIAADSGSAFGRLGALNRPLHGRGRTAQEGHFLELPVAHTPQAAHPPCRR